MVIAHSYTDFCYTGGELGSLRLMNLGKILHIDLWSQRRIAVPKCF